MTEERYPVMVNYQDAETARPSDRASMNPGGKWTGCTILHGVYRIGMERVLECCVLYYPFSSFCGGAWGHSPQVRLRRGSSWDGNIYNLGLTPIVALGPVEQAEMIDLQEWVPDPGAMTEAGWIEYGYRILANGMFSRMTRSGKRGIVFSGPVNLENSVAQFMAQIPKVTRIRQSTFDYSDFISMVPRRDPAASIVTASNRMFSAGIRAEVQDTPTWRNYNSGHNVRYYPVVLTTPLLGGEGYDASGERRDGWSHARIENEMQERWYRHSRKLEAQYGNYDNFAAAERGRVVDAEEKRYGVRAEEYTAAEQAYIAASYKYIRRAMWTN